MEWVDKYQLFLFDFDGLLVDTERLHFAAYVEMCRNRGAELTWDYAKFCSLAHSSATALREQIFAEFPFLTSHSWEVLYREKRSIYERLLQEGHLSLMPGVEALLRVLESKQARRCVVTNSARSQVDCIKSKIEVLQTIPLWITREDYVHAKPAPDGYLKAISLLGKPGDRVVGFEDSIRGLQSLLAANVEGVLVCSNQHPLLDASTPLQVPHFESMSDICL